MAFCLDGGDRVPRASTNQIPMSWGPAVPEQQSSEAQDAGTARARCQAWCPSHSRQWSLGPAGGAFCPCAPVRTDRLPAKRGALCPCAGLSSPSHVCLTALSARRDPGFQAELSHAIVPQNSSAPVFLARLKWADMFDFPLFPPACVRAVSPCFCRRVWRCCRAGTRSWEMVARAARAALHTWTCTKLIF